ncbi:UDP-N-acetylmuramoyl-L-alanine--D-glutamate ligase [Candidatus Saccharibacteria bacterium]|nr:UDP-N-acetylmuramoyl-L-alanine--D-glutamate ligase [Candidatus Saccharibacteria bacterium]
MKVAIAGYGLEGRASVDYWYSRGDEVTVLDENSNLERVPDGVSCVLGPQAFQSLSEYDLVVRTASLRPDRLQGAKQVWSATNEFFTKCPTSIIGVTGTKGKGTTCSLIASILRAADKTVHLVGNIGTPALEVLPIIKSTDIVVFELSSFQLWDIKKSPHIAVVLMIEPDHQDVHTDMDEYVGAKSNIRSNQVIGDVCFYHPTNQLSNQVAFTSTATPPRRYGVAEDGACYVKKDKFFIQDIEICNTKELHLVGQHNIENACAAISATWEYTREPEVFKKGINDFKGLPHRLKLVKEIQGVRYFDDSIATTPGSAIAAIKSFSEPKILILGGYDKGADYTELINLCRTTNTRVVTMGQTGEYIANLCKEVSVQVREAHESGMPEVVNITSSWAEPGDVVILSPASASFGMFKNYVDRGEQFIEQVNQLARELSVQ